MNNESTNRDNQENPSTAFGHPVMIHFDEKENLK